MELFNVKRELKAVMLLIVAVQIDAEFENVFVDLAKGPV